MNIIVDLQLKKIGLNHSLKKQVDNRSLIAIEMSISATNPSSRIVYLLPSVWIVRGFKIKFHQLDNSEFIKKAISDLNSSSEGYAEKHVTADYTEKYVSTDMPLPMLVAAGRLLIDQSLKPYEKVSRKIVLHESFARIQTPKLIR